METIMQYALHQPNAFEVQNSHEGPNPTYKAAEIEDCSMDPRYTKRETVFADSKREISDNDFVMIQTQNDNIFISQIVNQSEENCKVSFSNRDGELSIKRSDIKFIGFIYLLASAR